MKAYLNEDINSNFKKDGKKYKYGLKGDKVDVIGQNGHVMILENKSGLKFSALESQLTIINK